MTSLKAHLHLKIALGMMICVAFFTSSAKAAEECAAENVAITTTPALSTYPPAVKQYLQLKYPDGADIIMLGDSHVGHIPTDGLLTAIGAHSVFSVYGSGDGTNNTLWRLNAGEDKLKRLKPRLVVLMLGTNNTKHPACAIIEGLKKVIDKAQAFWPDARFVMVSLLPRGVLFDDDDETRGAVNAYFADYKGAHNFRFLQVNDSEITCGKLNFVLDNSFSNSKKSCLPEQVIPQCNYYLDDHTHLTKAGYTYLASLIAKE